MKTLHQLRQCQPHIVKCLRSAVKRLQAVNQHNLAVKAQKMVFIETFHHMLTVVVKPLLQHAEVTALVRLRQLSKLRFISRRPGEELQRGGARHIARQHKATGLNKV